jgi:hypothetical protein
MNRFSHITNDLELNKLMLFWEDYTLEEQKDLMEQYKFLKFCAERGVW